jgi:protein-disulfide isomerase
VLAALVGLVALVASPAFAQARDEVQALRREVEALKEGQAAILNELRELRRLLQARPAARPPEPRIAVLSIDGAPFLGDPQAKVVLIEFSDYHCQFCARHSGETLPQILAEYVKTGKVRYVFRDFPIEQLHPQAFKAHEAAYCAGDQGKYWEMHGRLFAHQNVQATPKELAAQAQVLGLNGSRFQECLDSGRHAARIRTSQVEGLAAGVSGTPSFFLGAVAPSDSKVRALRSFRGTQPYAAFKEAIDGLLARPKP